MPFDTLLTPDLIRAHSQAGSWHRKILPDYLDDAAAKYADKIAMVDRQGTLTWRQLQRLADRCAYGLYALGVRPGDVVSYQLPNWNEFAIVNLAATRIGAINNPLIPIYRHREIRFMLGLAESKVLVIPDAFREFDYPAMIAAMRQELPDLRHVLVIGSSVPAWATAWQGFIDTPWEADGDPSLFDRLRPDPNAVDHIVFTSGTTGEPKGVMHTHNTLSAPVYAWFQEVGITPADVIHMASTFAHQTGYLYAYRLAVMAGATGVWQDVWNAEQFLELVERRRVTQTAGATPFLHDILKAPGLDRRDIRSWRRFGCFGAPIPRSLVHECHQRTSARVMSGWGMTENALVTLCRPHDPEDKVSGTDGRALPGMEVRVVDDKERPVLPGVEGNLQARGSFTFVGYAKRLDYTRTQFREGGWFLTGDRAVMDADGYIRIAGRTKDIIIRGGDNIPVAYLENALYEHHAIDEVAVVAMPDERMQEKACAFLVVKPGHTIDLPGVQAFLEAKGVARQYWPERVEVRPEFPRTPSGKIQKFKLRQEVTEILSAERGGN